MKKISLLGFIFVLSLGSCKKENSRPEPIPPRDVQEVSTENDVALKEYLKTHFYNTATSTTNFNDVVGLDTIAGTNSDATPLYDIVKKKTYKILDANGKDIDHTFYYVILNEGAGNQATVADSSYVNYQGQLLTGKVFDKNTNAISINSWMDLLGDGSQNNGGTVKGFREAVSLLKASDATPSENSDGTVGKFKNFGTGIFFMPSAMAYFGGGSVSIPSYSPLIFTINLYKTKKADHDHDGILSIDEIKVGEYGKITFPDCNKNNLPDYLDAKNCNK